MHLSDKELSDFRNRCLQASLRGYTIAHSPRYLAALAAETGESDPPSGTKKGSAAHLKVLAEEVLALRAGKVEKKASKPKAPAPAPKKDMAPPPPPPEPEPEVEEELAYEEWSHEELYAEAKSRDLPGRSKMDKDELVAALEADDEADGG